MIEYILIVLYVLACLVLILFVLLQPGKADAAAVFGGGANSSAFGPRGTQTVLAKVTIGAAIAFFLIAFLFSIPGLFGRKSLGESVGPAQPAPIQQAPATTESTPAPASSTAPATSQPAGSGTTTDSKTTGKTTSPAQTKQDSKK